MNKIVWLLMLSVLFMSSCKNKGGSKVSIPDKILNNDFQFNYLTTRAKVDYIDKDQNLSTPVHIKIKQDSAIWMSITPALGIEMVRVLIRPDSVFMINRLKKEYYAGSFDIIRKQLGLEVNYVLVEKLLLGNIPLKSTSSQKLTKTDSHLILEQILRDFVIVNKINKSNARLDEIDINSRQEKGTETKILYMDFQPIDNVYFAHEIRMVQTGPGNQPKIDVKYGKVNVSEQPISMSFSIPDNYEPITLP